MTDFESLHLRRPHAGWARSCWVPAEHTQPIFSLLDRSEEWTWVKSQCREMRKSQIPFLSDAHCLPQVWFSSFPSLTYAHCLGRRSLLIRSLPTHPHLCTSILSRYLALPVCAMGFFWRLGRQLSRRVFPSLSPLLRFRAQSSLEAKTVPTINFTWVDP